MDTSPAVCGAVLGERVEVSGPAGGRRAGERHGRRHLAAGAEDRRRDGVQAELQLLDGARLAELPDPDELGPQDVADR